MHINSEFVMFRILSSHYVVDIKLFYLAPVRNTVKTYNSIPIFSLKAPIILVPIILN